jgi:hypothetical protein
MSIEIDFSSDLRELLEVAGWVEQLPLVGAF